MHHFFIFFFQTKMSLLYISHSPSVINIERMIKFSLEKLTLFVQTKAWRRSVNILSACLRNLRELLFTQVPHITHLVRRLLCVKVFFLVLPAFIFSHDYTTQVCNKKRLCGWRRRFSQETKFLLWACIALRLHTRRKYICVCKRLEK